MQGNVRVQQDDTRRRAAHLSILRYHHVSAQLTTTAETWQKGQDLLAKLRLETGGKIKAALLIWNLRLRATEVT